MVKRVGYKKRFGTNKYASQLARYQTSLNIINTMMDIYYFCYFRLIVKEASLKTFLYEKILKTSFKSKIHNSSYLPIRSSTMALCPCTPDSYLPSQAEPQWQVILKLKREFSLLFFNLFFSKEQTISL